MIEVPEADKNRTAIRAIAEVLAQGMPVTAGLARLYQFTHPSAFEQELQQWRRDVTQAVNTISEQLRIRLPVSEASLEVTRFLVGQAARGYGDDIAFQQIEDGLPEYDRATLQKACFDLEQSDLVRIEAAHGRPVLAVRPEARLFWTFDPYFLGTDPGADALEIARKLLEQDDGASVAAGDLETSLGWSRRRFNPAFEKVVAELPPGWLRQPMKRDYPATLIRVSPEVRAQLEHFVSG